MNNLPLQPLVWARIDTSKTDGIWCNKTSSYIEGAVSFCSTPVADYVIRKDKETGKYKTNYGGRTENPYDTIDDAEHWSEFTHYASQMQPYVKQPTLYPARFEEITDNDVHINDYGDETFYEFSGGFVVTFRDVPEAITQGDNLLDALDMAQDALSTAMEFYDEDNNPRPKPSEPQYGDVMISLLPTNEAQDD